MILKDKRYWEKSGLAVQRNCTLAHKQSLRKPQYFSFSGAAPNFVQAGNLLYRHHWILTISLHTHPRLLLQKRCKTGTTPVHPRPSTEHVQTVPRRRQNAFRIPSQKENVKGIMAYISILLVVTILSRTDVFGCRNHVNQLLREFAQFHGNAKQQKLGVQRSLNIWSRQAYNFQAVCQRVASKN